MTIKVIELIPANSIMLAFPLSLVADTAYMPIISIITTTITNPALNNILSLVLINVIKRSNVIKHYYAVYCDV